jgi:hypothetical protein
MVWYLARIIVCVTPSRIRWWKSRDAMDEPPREWCAPADTVYPKSDPLPERSVGATTKWSQRLLPDMIHTALSQGVPAHLTTLDPEGFPTPIRVCNVAPHPEGFRLVIPKGARSAAGKATLSFGGKEVFVGNAISTGQESLLRVERALPVHPFFTDEAQQSDTYTKLMKRVEDEAKRRGQPVPTVPERPPAPTEGAKLREKASRAFRAPGT